MTSAPRAWLIDASIYIFRAWFAFPDRWHSSEGYSLNAVYGYSKFLLDFLQRVEDTTYLAAAYDESLGQNYRNDLYPQYKSSRALPDEDLAFQLQCCRQMTQLLGIPSFGSERYEADDFLATLARVCRSKQIAVTVVTRDKDLGQIICNEDDRWWDFAADETLDGPGFEQRFGVRPDQFADYLALVGDPVDDIPGVPGVGAKTAAKLLQQFDTLDTLGADFSAVAATQIRGAASIAQKLETHWPQVQLARQLSALEDAVPEISRLPIPTLSAENFTAAADFLESLNIGGILVQRCRRMARECASP